MRRTTVRTLVVIEVAMVVAAGLITICIILPRKRSKTSVMSVAEFKQKLEHLRRNTTDELDPGEVEHVKRKIMEKFM